MKQTNTLDIQNNARIVHELMVHDLQSKLAEYSDAYNIPEEVVKGLEFSLYVKHSDRVLWKGGRTRFAKIFEKGLDEIMNDGLLTFEELGLVTFLATKHTEYEDNIIRINGEYASKQDLVDLFKEKSKNQASRNSDSYFKKVVSSLEKKKLLLSIPNPDNKRKKIYYISPVIFYKGQYIDKSVMDAIADKIREE